MSEKTKVAVVEEKPKALAIAKPSPGLLERMQDMSENLDSVEGVTLPKVKVTAAGFVLGEDQAALPELIGTIVHARKLNVYYKGAYDPSKIEPPTCFSNDGITPDSSIASPVAPSCKGCPMAEFGSNTRKGKACRNIKPIYLLLGDTAFIPRQLAITPTSLKAANNYLMELTERGLQYRKVRTKITAYKKNHADIHATLKFSLDSKLEYQQSADIEFLRNKWMPAMNNQSVDEREVESEVGPKMDPFNPGQTMDGEHVGL
jgi:hypothetical protein